jgi:hypothetical protein
VPRRTLVERASQSAAFHRAQIQAAWDGGDEITGPLGAAMRWLSASLALAYAANPDKAAEMYEHATQEIAGYAAAVHSQIAEMVPTGGRS